MIRILLPRLVNRVVIMRPVEIRPTLAEMAERLPHRTTMTPKPAPEAVVRAERDRQVRPPYLNSDVHPDDSLSRLQGQLRLFTPGGRLSNRL